MAGIPVHVKESIRKFKERISSDLKITKVFLFGSYSKGNFTDESDIDLCIIAENVDNSFLATLKIAPKVIGIDLRIEPIVYSSKDFEENSDFGLLKEIKEKGIEV